MLPTNPSTPAVPAGDLPDSPAESPSVASLLSESRSLHLQKTRAANRVINKQHRPDYRAAESFAARALALRLEAHDLDPDHLDPAWALDQAPHDAIVAFLRLYPEIP